MKISAELMAKYREAAVELREFSLGVKGKMEEAAETGELQDAKAALSELQARTEQVTTLRQSLDPTGIFLATYNVVVYDEHTVSFVLPRGVSRIEILQQAQGLVTERNLIWPKQLTEWKSNPQFQRAVERSERICIDGHVEGGDAKTRAQQEKFLKSKNLSMPALEDLAVAFAVYWVERGEPLFGWLGELNECTYVVRAVGSALNFYRDGLFQDDIHDVSSLSDLAVAARLPSRLQPAHRPEF